MEKFASTTALMRLSKKEAASCLRAIVRKRSFYLLSLLTMALPWQCLAGYVPPVGIPVPPFGIDQTVSMFASATYDFGKGPVSYPDAGNGPYTHYVDNKAPGATDTSNTYGTPSKPRLTVPTSAAPGSVIEIHGGPYGEFLPATAGFLGTSTKPIFIRGYSESNKPVMSVADKTIYKDTYLVLENIDFTDNQAVTGHQLRLEVNQESHHISIRYCNFHGVKEPATGGGRELIKIWTNSQTLPNQHEENVVIYRCNIHDNGWPATRENGIHGILPSNGTLGLWILENQIYNNGEDNIQIFFDGGRGTDSARFVYIGGNSLYENAPHTIENAVDVKQSNDVIISSNDMYGYRNTFASDGAAIVLNNDAPSDRLWVVNNHIHDSTIGIRNQSSGEIYVVGNLIENINHEPGQGYTGLAAQGAGFFSNATASTSHPEYTRTMHVVNNTFYHCDQGIIFSRGATYYAENNIVSELNYKDGSVWDLAKNSDSTTWTVKNNLLFQTGAAPIIHVSSNYTAASFDAAGNGSGNLAANPLFVTAGSNFALQDKSPAIGAGIVSSVYATFQSLYGRSIALDRNGVNRPVSGWDIGAYEFGTTSELPPEAPANLHITTPP